MLYVLDAGASTVVKLSSAGKILASTGGFGWAEGAFDRPADIAVANGLDVYVADYGNHRIQRFDRTLTTVAILAGNAAAASAPAPGGGGAPAAGTLPFGYPKSIALSRSGTLFVADAENGRIVAVDPSGEGRALQFGGNEASEGRLTAPSRIRAGGDDRLYVLDGATLKAYDVFGNFLAVMPGEGKGAFAAGDSVLYRISGTKLLAAAPSGSAMLDLPPEVATDDVVDMAVRDGILYLLTANHIFMLPLPAPPGKE